MEINTLNIEQKELNSLYELLGIKKKVDEKRDFVLYIKNNKVGKQSDLMLNLDVSKIKELYSI